MGLNPLKRVNSILTMGRFEHLFRIAPQCLNPLKRVNSILTSFNDDRKQISDKLSQSPQTGQFNSYYEVKDVLFSARYNSLNPLKRVNSILT